MQDSQVVLGWTADAVRKAEVATRRGDVLDLAKTRFEGELTEEDRQMIATQDSADVLRDWLRAVMVAKNYADLRSILRR